MDRRRQVRAAVDDAAARPADLRLEAFLPYRLNVLAATVSESLSKVYGRRYGIGIAEWRVLVTLGEAEQSTATDIGASTRMHKTKVSRAFASLEEKGLIARRTNAEDKREAYAALTQKGRAIYLELVPLALGFARDLEAVLEPQERAAFDRALSKLFARALHLSEAFEGTELGTEGDEE